MNRSYIKKMIVDSGFPDDENIDILVDDTMEVFSQWFRTKVMKKLGRAELISKFIELIEGDVPDSELFAFLSLYITDLNSFLQNLYGEFEEEYRLSFQKYKS